MYEAICHQYLKKLYDWFNNHWQSVEQLTAANGPWPKEIPCLSQPALHEWSRHYCWSLQAAVGAKGPLFFGLGAQHLDRWLLTNQKALEAAVYTNQPLPLTSYVKVSPLNSPPGRKLITAHLANERRPTRHRKNPRGQSAKRPTPAIDLRGWPLRFLVAQLTPQQQPEMGPQRQGRHNSANGIVHPLLTKEVLQHNVNVLSTNAANTSRVTLHLESKWRDYLEWREGAAAALQACSTNIQEVVSASAHRDGQIHTLERRIRSIEHLLGLLEP